MAASGTTKKSTINQLLGSGGTATLASATITGDLTVDTSTLKVDSANNRVGIKQASPSHPFQIGTTDLILDASANLGLGVTPSASSVPTLQFPNGVTLSNAGTASSFAHNAVFNSGWKYVATGAATLYQKYAGAHAWYTAASGGIGSAITFTQAMTLHASGGLSVGNTTDPGAANLSVGGAFFTGGSLPGVGNSNPFAYRIGGGGLGIGAATETGTTAPMVFYTGQGGVERVRIKATGQVRFQPLAADPAGAEAGDVYYNSVSNKLKCYNGTTWNDLF
jgi:hypothetical protein